VTTLPSTALSLATLLAVVACSRAGGPPRRPPLPAGKAEQGGPDFLPSTTEVDEPTTAATPPATVVALRAAAHEDFDRVTIELAGALPGYRVAWAPARPRQCGSGKAVDAGGTAWLVVRLDPAQAHDEQGRVTVDTSESPGLPAVGAMASSCDFEGVVSWVLGSPARLPFRVLALSDPPRLVVDVAHPGAQVATTVPTP
jgi:hypothetical protein